MLKAVKTVAVVRFASKFHRLASVFRTASATGIPGAWILNPRPSAPPFQGALAAFSSGSLRLSLPPALRRADYRCQSADAELTPVWFPNPCRLCRHPLPGELAAIEATAPVIVLPLWFFVFIVVVMRIVWDYINQKGSECAVILLLLVFLYPISRQVNAIPLYSILVLLRIWRLLIIPAFGEILRQWYAKVSARPSLSSTHYPLSGAGAKPARACQPCAWRNKAPRCFDLSGRPYDIIERFSFVFVNLLMFSFVFI